MQVQHDVGRGAAGVPAKVVILDEPTATLGVRESAQVLQLVWDLRDQGLPVITTQSHTPSEAMAIMTGAMIVA